MRKIRFLNLKWNTLEGGHMQHYLHVARNLNTNRFDVKNVCGINIKRKEPLGRIKTLNPYIIPLRYKYDMRAIPKLAKFIRINNIDVVYALENSSIFICGLVKLIAKKPFKLIVSTAGAPFHDTKLKKMWSRLFYYITILFMNFTASKVLAVSKKEKDLLIKRGVKKNKIAVVYNGIDLTPYLQSVNIENKKNKLGIDKNATVIGTVARLTPVKGIHFLFQSIPSILNHHPNSIFLIVGDGYIRKELEDFAVKTGINENIIFTGYRKDIPSLLKIFDIFVIPSLKEGFPYSILEAMAAAKPVVATNVAGNNELVVNGKTGILCASKNPDALSEAIISLLNDKDKIINMGKKGFNLIKKNYSITNIIKQLEQEIEAVINF